MEDKVGKISIICFGYNHWSDMWKRVQQYIYLLSQEEFIHHVVFVNPDVWTNDFKVELNRIKDNKVEYDKHLRHLKKEIYPITEKLTVWTPFRRIPKARSVFILGKLEKYLLKNKISKLFKQRKMDRVLVWMNQPRDPGILDLIQNKVGVVFDWSDDWVAFGLYENRSASMMKSKSKTYCDYYLKNSVLNLTVTPELHRRALALNPNSYLVPNATDYENFSKAAQYSSTTVNSVMSNVSKPVIGYIGYILNRIDFKLVGNIATRHPEWQFVFLGPRMESLVLPEIVKNATNVKFLDPVPYKKLSEYMIAMDVFIIPHHIDQATIAMSPIKIYDYAATGKPIVCTAVQDRDALKELLYVANSEEGFEKMLELALSESDESLVKQRQQFAFNNCWEKRVQEIVDLLKKVKVVSSSKLVESKTNIECCLQLDV